MKRITSLLNGMRYLFPAGIHQGICANRYTGDTLVFALVEAPFEKGVIPIGCECGTLKKFTNNVLNLACSCVPSLGQWDEEAYQKNWNSREIQYGINFWVNKFCDFFDDEPQVTKHLHKFIADVYEYLAKERALHVN